MHPTRAQKLGHACTYVDGKEAAATRFVSIEPGEIGYEFLRSTNGEGTLTLNDGQRDNVFVAVK